MSERVLLRQRLHKQYNLDNNDTQNEWNLHENKTFFLQDDVDDDDNKSIATERQWRPWL